MDVGCKLIYTAKSVEIKEALSLQRRYEVNQNVAYHQSIYPSNKHKENTNIRKTRTSVNSNMRFMFFAISLANRLADDE